MTDPLSLRERLVQALIDSSSENHERIRAQDATATVNKLWPLIEPELHSEASELLTKLRKRGYKAYDEIGATCFYCGVGLFLLGSVEQHRPDCLWLQIQATS